MSRCVAERRCKRRECDHCGPIRAGDEFHRFKANIEAYGGPILVVAITAPGADVLPWQTYEMVKPDTGEIISFREVALDWQVIWNGTASARYARLWKAASLSADRLLRRHGYRGQLPRRVAQVWSPQKRAVWHVHEALPAKTEVERLWSRQVVRYIDNVRKREFGIPAEERRRWLIEEHRGTVRRSFYGWGYVDRNPLRELGRAREADRSASYLASNAAEYLGQNASESARRIRGRKLRTYVSRRLTMVTGVTLTNLRRKRYLHVLIARGEALPSWPEDVLETVWLLLVGGVVAARGP